MKQTARRMLDVLSLGVLQTPPLEKMVVQMLRQHPRRRLSQFLCQSFRRAATRCKSPYRMATIDGGCKLMVDISDFLGPIYLCGDEYEPESTLIFKSLIQPGDVVFDIGANAGFYTLIAANSAGPTGHVHAFEPNPKLMSCLKQSIVASGFQDRVTPNSVAVSESCSSGQKLYVSTQAGNSGLSSLILYSGAEERGVLSDHESIDVETVTFDVYAEQHGVQRCGLVKIDVETAEMSVLKGMTGSLEKKLPQAILCETAIDGKADQFIRGFGYRGYLPEDIYEFFFEGKTQRFGNLLYLAPDRELPAALTSVQPRD